MQRPMMDPMLMLDDGEDAVEPGGRRRRGAAMRWREGLTRAAVLTKVVARVLFSKPFRIRRREPEDGQPVTARLFRGLGYRLLFVPIFLALAAAALVYRGTHPVRHTSAKLPAVPGVFYESLEFAGPDGHPLMAWFVPVVDEKRVIELKDKVFKSKQPAAVLVHDFNSSPSQMVPLIAPLHQEGFVVIAVGLRGVGRGHVAAQTFGLNESNDVRAAIAELRTRPTVDSDRIAVIGLGSGANAAVIAAAQEPCVKALVLINAAQTPEAAIATHVGPNRAGFRWMQLPSKWAFEMAYHVDADDLHLSRFREVLSSRPTLSLGRQQGAEFDKATVESIRTFCKEHVPVEPPGGKKTATADVR
jgi:pimeloyl-ACP methyl ester carboxylesterase